MPVPKAVMQLILPSVISCLVMILYNMADTFFVGMLDDPGATSAVTLAASVILAFNAVNNLAGVGCSSYISRSLGVKDTETAKRTGAFGFWFAIAAGALFSLICTVWQGGLLRLLGANAETWDKTADYLFWTVTCGAVPAILNVVIAQLVKAEGMALHAAIGTMSGCILNIILDPFFVLPKFLGMGAAGAGCATFISNCAACLYYFVLMAVKRGSMVLDVRPRNLKIRAAMLKEVFSVGVPAAIQNLLNVTGMTILNNFMSAYGAEAVSAIGIAHKMAMIPMYISMGMSQGIMPLVGYNYAAENKKRMRDAILYTARISAAVMVVSTALYCIFPDRIVTLFMKNPLVVSYGAAFLIGQSLAQPFLCIDFMGVGIFQACGMGQKSFLFAILRKVVLEIPALFILGKLWPMYGLAYAALFAELVLGTVAFFEIRKIIRVPES